MTNFTEKFNSITVAFNANGAQLTNTYTNIAGGELWDKLKTPRIGDKNGAHFLRSSLKHDVDGNCLSRGDAHCTAEAWLIIIDVDEATAPPQAVHEALIQADTAHIIIGTHSYYADNINRFRVLLLSDAAYSKDQLEPTSEAVVEIINCLLTSSFIEYAKENKVYSQAWFTPSMPQNCEKALLYLEYTEGQFFPVRNKQEPPDISQPIPQTIALKQGQISPITTWNQQYPVSVVLQEHDYKLVFRNAHTCRWLSPNSTSGQAGVIEDQNTGKVFSHHNDCLNDNYSHDSFDVMRLLKNLSFEDAIKFASQNTRAPNGLSVDEYNKSTIRITSNKTQQPRQLPSSRPNVMSLQADMIPDAIREYIFDVAERQQSLPDFVAVAAIIGLSGLLGRKALICPKQLDDWSVTPNQWGAIIGRPSAMKSPSMKEALKPLRQFDTNAAQQFEEDKINYDEECQLIELEKLAAKDKAKKALKADNRQEAREALQRMDFIDLPVRQRLVVNDATIEKLGELLNENPNGLILVRDELSGWLSKLAKEEYQSDRAFYLECFDGNGHYTYDRIGRGTIEIQYCTLSIIGGIQPSKIATLVRDAIRGTSDDGLIQRFQLAIWPDDIGRWEWIDRAPNQQARAKYNTVFEMIHCLHFNTEDDEPYRFRFTNDAQALFIKWMKENQDAARSPDIHPALESHILKMPQTIAGLALLFEIIDGGRESVGIEATARALDWADYLISHAHRLYSLAINHSLDSARLILERKSRLPDPFSTRDIQRKGWSGLDSIDAVNDALN